MRTTNTSDVSKSNQWHQTLQRQVPVGTFHNPPRRIRFGIHSTLHLIISAIHSFRAGCCRTQACYSLHTKVSLGIISCPYKNPTAASPNCLSLFCQSLIERKTEVYLSVLFFAFERPSDGQHNLTSHPACTDALNLLFSPGPSKPAWSPKKLVSVLFANTKHPMLIL